MTLYTIADDQINKLKSNAKQFAENIETTELEKMLLYLSDQYFNTGKSIVSDVIYDFLLDTLKVRNPSSSVLNAVGSKAKRSIKLPVYAKSLNKYKTEKEFEKWKSEYGSPYIISDKLDGVSCLLVKQDSNVKLFTRGDGEFGSDITQLAKYVLSDIKFSKLPKQCVVRGELIISKSNFATIQHKMENARNAVSGLVNSKKIREDVAKITSFVVYNIMLPVMNYDEQLATMRDANFEVVDWSKHTSLSFDSLNQTLLTRRNISKYDIDGIVVTVAQGKYENTNANPLHAFAYKSLSANKEVEVVVLFVEWNTSKDGYMKPKIKIDPVKLAGVTIKSLTGFNGKYIYDNEIGVGTVLKIIRSGDVIPHITEIVSATKAQMPTCSFKWTDSGVDIIATDDSKQKKIKKITHFMKILNVKNIDEKIIEKLIDNGIGSISKILKTSNNEYAKIEGFGDKLTDKIKTNLKTQLLNTNLETFMAASQCFGRGISIKKIKKILHHVPQLYEHCDNYDSNYKTKIYNLVITTDGINQLTADQFVDGINKFDKFFDAINEVIDVQYLRKSPTLLSTKESTSMSNGNTTKTNKIKKMFENQIVVFTGVRNRELEQMIEQHGGKVVNAISSKSTLLICSDTMNMNTEKLQKAHAQGIKVVKISDVLAIV